MLETRDLTIRFGGHVAVDHVSCAFEAGTLTAIVGPNGAGKTTYFNLISGQLRASEGRVRLNGDDITPLPAPLRTRRGLGRAFQLTQLFPNLSVLENVRLAVQARAQGRGEAGLDLLRMLKAKKDRCILLVEHKMDVVRELADRIVVLHNGAKVADGEPAAVIASPIVQQAYLGLAPQAEAA